MYKFLRTSNFPLSNPGDCYLVTLCDPSWIFKKIITALGLKTFWVLSPWDSYVGEVDYCKLVSIVSYLFYSCVCSAGCYWALNKKIIYFAWILNRNLNILLLIFSLILFRLLVWNNFRHRIFWLNILKLYIYVWFSIYRWIFCQLT